MKNNNKAQLQPCERFGDSDYSRLASGKKPELEFELIEHAHTCSHCRKGIQRATTAYKLQKEKSENELLHSNALSVMDGCDQAKENNVFGIVVRAFQGVVKHIWRTGEQMIMVPAISGARSTTGTIESGTLQPLRLVKEFEESKLSVEVTISPVEPDMLDVIVSLLDRQLEEFISGVSVSCRGESEIFDETTDNNGQASFKVPAAGFYELVMKKNDHLLGTMTLTGL